MPGSKKRSSSSELCLMEDIRYYSLPSSSSCVTSTKECAIDNNERKKMKKGKDQQRKKERERKEGENYGDADDDEDEGSNVLSVASRNSAAAEDWTPQAAPSVVENKREIVVKKNNDKDSNESQFGASSRNVAPSVNKNQLQSRSKAVAIKNDAQNQASEGVLQLTQKFKVEPMESSFDCVDCGRNQKVISQSFVIKSLHGFCAYCGRSMCIEFS